MGCEGELKLSINKADAKKLHQIPLIVNSALSKPTKHKITSIYFDTSDFMLLDAGITLRIRHESHRWIQTIKLAGSAKCDLHRRNEWEDLVRTGQPDYTKITDPKLIRVFSDPKLRPSLKPIFQTAVINTQWLLAFDNGDQVKLSLHSGVLTSNQRQETISEIELELTAGNVSRIFEIALALQQDIPFNIENVSMAERGYAYYRPQMPPIFKSNFPTLDKHLNADAAFKKIAWECIHHLQSNQHIVLMESDIEGIHQMRVALRRLRSAFTLFKNLIHNDESIFLLSEINWLADKMGKVRDLDVLMTDTLPRVTQYSKNHKGFVMPEEQASQARLLMCQDMQSALMSQRYQRLLLMLGAWLEKERGFGTEHQLKNYTLLIIARKSLNKLYKKLRKCHVQFMDMTSEQRHVVRIAVKKLRYASEFFSSLFPAKRVDPFIKQLTRLQDSLGQLNDIHVAGNLLQSISGPIPNANVNDAILIFEKWGRKRADQKIPDIDARLQKLLSVKPFWIDMKNKAH